MQRALAQSPHLIFIQQNNAVNFRQKVQLIRDHDTRFLLQMIFNTGFKDFCAHFGWSGGRKKPAKKPRFGKGQQATHPMGALQSKAERQSSMSIMSGLEYTALAMLTRCFCVSPGDARTQGRAR